MNQVNVVKKRANKSKKKNYYSTDKNEQNPYNVQGRVTLPLNFLSNAVKKTIRGNNDGDKWSLKKPSDKVAVNYKSATDYYVKALKEKPKSFVQNDDCSIFKEINRLFRNKFENKTSPAEPDRSIFCVNLAKQLKGIRVESSRKSSLKRISYLIQSDELDELPEVDNDDSYNRVTRRDIVTRRSPFEYVPAIPSFKFVFTTPVKQRLNLVTRIDLSGLDFSRPDDSNLSDAVLTFSPLCTIGVNQNNSSVLEVGSFLLESFRNEQNQRGTTPIYFTPPESSNFKKFMNFSISENFPKRITSPVSQNYKRSKVYFTPPETIFDQNNDDDHYGNFNFFMEPPQNLFNRPFISPTFTKNYFDLD